MSIDIYGRVHVLYWVIGVHSACQLIRDGSDDISGNKVSWKETSSVSG